MAANIIARKAIMGKVASFGIDKSDDPPAYKNIYNTSNTTNINM
jgi:hypothetical protein